MQINSSCNKLEILKLRKRGDNENYMKNIGKDIKKKSLVNEFLA
jgi:hypothetical protein